MKNYLLLIFVSALVCVNAQTKNTFSIIPMPNLIRPMEGKFVLSSQTKIVASDTANYKDAFYLRNFLKEVYDVYVPLLTDYKNTSNAIVFNYDATGTYKKEQYDLNIQANKITITALKGGSGFFYGIQSLIQILPLYQKVAGNPPQLTFDVPCVKIQDAPRFKYRGMHLDVSRHFFRKEFVKKYIDLLALYKFNTCHWHLTDAQGWRIEIKKYPLLTTVGAFRSGSMIGTYSDQKFDDLPYGGFYTQNDIREIVAYAKQRHITILPEIEMPGHSQAALAAYPWLGCKNQTVQTAKAWGVFENVFCSKDSTFNFIKDVLDEVIALFPGDYIHIGGDECPKLQWKACPTCQARLKKEGLKDENELQSFFIKRVSNYLKTKKRSIVGWDEIIEGGLAPGATVMSWRGFDGGVEAAKMKHDVIMTPGEFCYFDHYQAQPKDEPVAIGGFTPLEKVYAFEPVPASLNDEEKKYVKGAQANVWTEYMATEEHVEYMLNPRLAALSEVLWTKKENKNESDFLRRVQNHFALYKLRNINFSKTLYDVNFSLKPAFKNNVLLSLTANKSLGDIYYTNNSSLPVSQWSKYDTALMVPSTVDFAAAVLKDGKLQGKILQRKIHINKATGKELKFKTEPSKYYNKGGAFTLVNGIKAVLPRINNEWLGWSGDDMELTLDLGESTNISTLEVGFLNEELNWIYLPRELEFFTSEDGLIFKSLGNINTAQIKEQNRVVTLKTETLKTRYVKISAKNAGKIPSGKPGAGENCWLFCDEISID
ncbi:MAG: family 20 glycosylhydrolase [Bacteroidia bacterium]|nr:family 20 glycosylhydrolase [Bacteroidia bacterium]